MLHGLNVCVGVHSFTWDSGNTAQHKNEVYTTEMVYVNWFVTSTNTKETMNGKIHEYLSSLKK